MERPPKASFVPQSLAHLAERPGKQLIVGPI